jgi:hypothetical protein
MVDRAFGPDVQGALKGALGAYIGRGRAGRSGGQLLA